MTRSKSVSTTLVALTALLVTACAPAPPPAPTAKPAAPVPAAPAPAASPVAAPAPAAPAASPVAAPAAAPAASPAAAPAAAPAASPAAAAPAAKPDAAAKPGTLTKVRYGLPTAPPAITTVGVYYALENGYFRDEGLDVEVTPYPGATTAIRALLSREAEIVMTGGDTAFLAQASGAPIKIISSPVEKGTDVVVASKAVGSLKDLGGKKWGISQPNDTSHVAAKLLAERNGVNPEQVEFLAIGGPPDRARALISGRVDVSSMTILILKPILDAIDAGDVKVLTSLATEFPNLPLAYNVTRDDVAKDQGQLLTRFLKAEIKGYRWAQQNPEQAATIAEKHIREVDHALMTRGMKGMSELGVYGLEGGISLEKIDQTQKLLVDLGALRRTVKADEVATTQFVEQAVKELGPAPR
jgi:ABC-type nitrate/sulfonate/bicarbonate transport system substrate-binding protein